MAALFPQATLYSISTRFCSLSCPNMHIWILQPYLGHRRLALEASPHTVVNSFWLPPALADAHETVALMALEARSACSMLDSLFLCTKCRNTAAVEMSSRADARK